MILGFSFYLNAQTVEKIFESAEIHMIQSDDEFEGGKNLGIIYLTNLEENVNINYPYARRHYVIKNGSFENGDKAFFNCYGWFHNYGKYSYYVTFNNNVTIIDSNENIIGRAETAAGISFVLKNENGYFFFYVDKNNKPGAIDSNGKIYNSNESMNFLRLYDSVKYDKSREYANKIGIQRLFDLNSVLIWDGIYYSSIKNLNDIFRSELSLYEHYSCPINYDLNGIGYQSNNLENFWDNNNANQFCVVRNGEKLIKTISLPPYSKILQDAINGLFSSVICSYDTVGLSGNIYFYISNTKETEVFRIRNIWDSTNLYALAINGYTEDFYGDYVKEVLPKMSKADLRLLRNTIFALYGVHFKSEDLNTYFDKQVWYTDKGLSSDQVTLPAHRQKLIEMIQKLEK